MRAMTLRRKVFVGYASQIYAALIALIMLPIYLQHLGIESYALIGFSTMLFAWLQLLDMGLTPTLSRELSLYRAGSVSRVEALQLLNNLEWCFGLLAVMIFICFASASALITAKWLKPEYLGVDEIETCIKVMGAMAGIRWLSSLYNSGLVGLGEQAKVGIVLSVMATIKSVGVVLVIAYVSKKPQVFFWYQGLATLIEMLWLRHLVVRMLGGGLPIPFPQLAVLQKIKKFAGAMAFLAMLWVAITQIDKLLLSYLLPLKEYGYFMLAISAATGVTLVITPFNQVVQPQLTKLRAQKEDLQFMALYRKATQVACLALAVSAGILAIYAEPLLLIWTGDPYVTSRIAQTLFWYAFGNGLAGVLLIPFWLQFAHGNLRFHVVGNLIFGAIWIPLIIYSATHFGPVGVARAWFGGNLAFLLCWVTYMHSHLAADIKWSWLIRDVCMVVGAVLAILYAMSWVDLHGAAWPQVLGFLTLTAILAALGGSLVGDRIRPLILSHFRKFVR